MNKDKEGKPVSVGKIIGLHGIGGEVKILPYEGVTGFPWETVFIDKKEVALKKARAHKGLFIVEFEGLSTRELSRGILGKEVSVRREDLPELPEDEFYLADLEGLDVWSDDGRYLGSVKNIFSTGSNDVLEVMGPLGEVLIPAIEGVIKGVDIGSRKITVHLLEGLLPEEKE